MKKLALLFACISFLSISVSAQIVNGVAKGSIVTLADGIEVSIEEIKAGDMLLTLNADNHIIVVSKVKSVHEAATKGLQKVFLADGKEVSLSSAQTILSDKGWVALDARVAKEQVKNLNVKIGDCKVDNFIFSISNDSKIELLPIIDVESVSDGMVYTLELDTTSAAYIVNGIFVGQ